MKSIRKIVTSASALRRYDIIDVKRYMSEPHVSRSGVLVHTIDVRISSLIGRDEVSIKGQTRNGDISVIENPSIWSVGSIIYDMAIPDDAWRSKSALTAVRNTVAANLVASAAEINSACAPIASFVFNTRMKALDKVFGKDSVDAVLQCLHKTTRGTVPLGVTSNHSSLCILGGITHTKEDMLVLGDALKDQGFTTSLDEPYDRVTRMRKHVLIVYNR